MRYKQSIAASGRAKKRLLAVILLPREGDWVILLGE